MIEVRDGYCLLLFREAGHWGDVVAIRRRRYIERTLNELQIYGLFLDINLQFDDY